MRRLPGMRQSLRTGLILGAYALLALLVIPIYPHFVSPNEFTRWALDVAILERHSLEVTSVVAKFGPRFEDLARRDGRLYTNKAPGTALLALPAHAVARLFSDAIRPTLTEARIAAATVPVLLTALLILRFAKRNGVAPERARVVTWIALFATPLFAYGFLLFAHALVAMALLGAWLFLDEERHALAGALTGLAVAAEYTAVFAAAILLISVAAQRDWRRLLKFVAAGTPFALLLAAYHAAAFGSVFSNPYEFSTEYRALHASGLFGLSVPSVATAAKILIDPTYGLFIFSPVLLLGIAAIPASRVRLSKMSWWTMLLIPIVLLVVYAGYPYWYGGWNVAARFLVPAIPFVVVPLLFRPNTSLEALLAGASTITVALTTLVFPFVPEPFAFPWTSLAMPLLGKGLVAPNLLHLISKPLAIAVPFAMVIAAAIAALGWRRSGIAAVGVAVALVAGSAWTWFTDEPLVRIERDYIEEVYFERAGSMRGTIPAGLQRRRAVEQRLPPGDWPF